MGGGSEDHACGVRTSGALVLMTSCKVPHSEVGRGFRKGYIDVSKNQYMGGREREGETCAEVSHDSRRSLECGRGMPKGCFEQPWACWLDLVLAFSLPFVYLKLKRGNVLPHFVQLFPE